MNTRFVSKVAVAGMLLASVGSAVAQNADVPKSGAPASTSAAGGTGAAAQAQSGIVKRDGVVYLLKDGATQRVVQDMQLSEGIHVNQRGDVKLADGKQIKLSDGQMVNLQGQVMNAPAGVAEQTGVGTGTTSTRIESGAGAVSGGTSNGSGSGRQGSAAGATTKAPVGTGPAGTGANAGQ
jgi:hypothetical protein